MLRIAECNWCETSCGMLVNLLENDFGVYETQIMSVRLTLCKLATLALLVAHTSVSDTIRVTNFNEVFMSMTMSLTLSMTL